MSGEQKEPSKKMHHMVDLLIENADESQDYQAQLNEIVEIEKEFHMLNEHLSLAKRYYKNLAKQVKSAKRAQSNLQN